MAETRSLAATHEAARVRNAKRRRRLFINSGIAVILIAAMLVIFIARRTKVDPAAGLITDTVKRADVLQTVSATGSVTPQTGAEVKIGSQITGTIKKLYADIGTHMRAGEVIAELNVPDLHAAVDQAEATLALNQKRLQEQLSGVALQNTQTATDIRTAQAGVATARANLAQVQNSVNREIASAQAGVRQAQANATNSAANLRREQELYQKGYVAASDVDNARAQDGVNQALLVSAQQNLALTQAKVATDLPVAQNALNQAESTLAAKQAAVANNSIKLIQVQEARAAVKQAQAQVAQAQAQLAKAYIRSPISGTVLQLAQQEGETIAAGLSAPTLIVVADLNRLQVDAFVDETDIAKVDVGQPAQITVDAYPNRIFRGRVAKIASGSTLQQNVVTYDVTIALENPHGLLKPDMTATVNIQVAREGNVLTVPVDAIKPGLHGNAVTTMTIGSDGKPQFKVVPVRTGVSDGEKTEILSGLNEGDTVVLAGQAPGMETQQNRGPHFGLFGPGGGRGGGSRGGGRGH